MSAFLVGATNIQKMSDVCPRVLKRVVGYRNLVDFKLLKVVVCDLVDKVLHITPQAKFNSVT